jgi:hypothetical protein
MATSSFDKEITIKNDAAADVLIRLAKKPAPPRLPNPLRIASRNEIVKKVTPPRT